MRSDEVLELLQRVAADVIQPRFRSLSAGEVHEKQPGDLVTVADHESEDAITAELRRRYPDALVVGEEAVVLGSMLRERELQLSALLDSHLSERCAVRHTLASCY